jgi:hypothetical protein
MPFTLVIKERGHSWAGRPPAKSSHTTREEAEAELARCVRANWDAEVGNDGPPPDDQAAMVHEYFDEVLESYDISEQAS